MAPSMVAISKHVDCCNWYYVTIGVVCIHRHICGEPNAFKFAGDVLKAVGLRWMTSNAAEALSSNAAAHLGQLLRCGRQSQ